MKEIDISKHELVPKHETLSEAEKADVLKLHGIVLRQLPRILDSDPMVVRLNAKLGDVIRITRKSATAGVSQYYRVVIKG